jgi:phage tail protein X
VSADESDAAKEDLWLTYQNYDPAVKQAVRRLGALPGNNVEEFRTLLLASRERSRAKEFEADVVRRLQGEAFVDDEVLQQTLIVLHAENPGLAEQFKTFVAANGRPDDIDLAVARLRSGTDDPVMPERLPRKPRETPIMAQAIVPELIPEMPAPEMLAPEVTTPEIPLPVRAPAEKKKPSRPGHSHATATQVFADRPLAGKSEDAPRTSWTKYAAIAAALLLIGAAGLFFLMPASFMPKSGDKPVFEATTVPLRQAAVEDKQPAKPAPSVQTPPAQAEARNDEVNIPSPPPPSEPPLRAAAPEAAPVNNSTNGPVPGSRYRVVKGDMLSVIAMQAYGNASLFRLIQRANPELRSADRIYYDQMITLPPKP